MTAQPSETATPINAVTLTAGTGQRISSSAAADTAVVLDQTAAEPLSLADRFGDFLTSIVEYFR